MIPITELMIFCKEQSTRENVSNYDLQHYNEIIDTLILIIGKVPFTEAFRGHIKNANKKKTAVRYLMETNLNIRK